MKDHFPEEAIEILKSCNDRNLMIELMHTLFIVYRTKQDLPLNDPFIYIGPNLDDG